MLKTNYYLNLSVYYFNIKDIEASQTFLNQANQLAEKTPPQNPSKNTTANALIRARFCIDFANHQTEGYEDFFLQDLKYPQTKRIRSHDHFSLTKYYLFMQEYDKVKQHLHKVIEHGNKLYIVEEAKDILRSLEV